MYKSENNFRGFVALAATVFFGGLFGLLVLGYLGLANVRLRQENQALRAETQRPVYQQAPPVFIEAKPPIHVHVLGEYNNVYFDYTDLGGATGDVNVEGYNGTTTIHLCQGQTAQVTISGAYNVIHVAAGLSGRVSCTNVGENSSVVAWQ